MKNVKRLLGFIIVFMVVMVAFCSVSFAADSKISLLMHMDGTNNSKNFIDETGKIITPKANAIISTSQSKFGGASSYFDGTQYSYLSIAANGDLDFDSGDFTVELWYYPTDANSRYGLYFTQNSNFAIDFNYQGTRNINIWASSNGTSWNMINADPGGNGIGSKSLTLNTWNHIVVSRQGNTWRTFINGVKDKEINVSGTIATSQYHLSSIGAWGDGSWYPSKGYIDEVRVDKGIARYTSNFTPPAESYSAVRNLTAVPGDSKVNLAWTSDVNATSYTVKRALTASGPYTTIATTSAITYTDTTTTNGTTYYYVVSAVTNGAQNLNSNEVSATPTAPVITRNPGIVEITMTNGQIKEYDLTGSELQAFLDWYDGRSEGTGKAYYTITKKNNIKPFLSRKEYISFDKISSFEVNEYAE